MSTGSLTQGSLGGSHGLPDPIGNAIATAGNGEFDPLNIFAVNQPGGSNYNAIHGSPLPGSLPVGPGAQMQQSYSPNSFIPRTPQGAGLYNLMAAQLAGPAYQPTALSMAAAQPNIGGAVGAGVRGGNYGQPPPWGMSGALPSFSASPAAQLPWIRSGSNFIRTV